MILSKYFSLGEMTRSDTASRKRFDNTPIPEHLENLVDTCRQADAIRELLGHPMVVSSGYRSAKLNAAIGGSRTSSHMQGYALDFICPGFGDNEEVFNAIRKSGIPFDQLILEYPDSPSGGWVHIGFAPSLRRQTLIFDGQYRMA